MSPTNKRNSSRLFSVSVFCSTTTNYYTRVAPNSFPPSEQQPTSSSGFFFFFFWRIRKRKEKKKKFRLFLLLRRSSHTTREGGRGRETLWKNQMFQTKRCFYGKHTQIQNLPPLPPKPDGKNVFRKKKEKIFWRKKEKRKNLIFLGFFLFSSVSRTV